MTPFLNDQEVAEMCAPLRQPAAIKRYLTRIGVPFKVRPDGHPIVSRQVVADVLSLNRGEARDATTEPNLEGLTALFSKKEKTRGSAQKAS